MSIDPQKVRSLFLQAVERCEPGQWDSFLETACGDDLPLRDRVAAMLAEHLGEDSVLDVEANLYAPTIDRLPEWETKGTQLIVLSRELCYDLRHAPTPPNLSCRNLLSCDQSSGRPVAVI